MSGPNRSSPVDSAAQWIWLPHDAPPAATGKTNLFSWFRTIVELDEIPEQAELLFAADSNAALWINGVALRRKVTRYHQRHIRAEVVNAGPHLRRGANVVVVLHHNWGDVITFQRDGNEAPRFFVGGSWLGTGAHWRCRVADEYLHHAEQIIGIVGNAPRIRFPVVLDGARDIAQFVHSPAFDDSSWPAARVIHEPAWAVASPAPVETPGQREFLVRPTSVLNAGFLVDHPTPTCGPRAIADRISAARCQPVDGLRSRAQALCAHRPTTLYGKAGESFYITFDFHRPVHGFPTLGLEASAAGIVVDFGYAEVARPLYSANLLVREDGWLDTKGVVGCGYADRYITRAGAQEFTLPDERTARWMTLHATFVADATLTLNHVAIVSSQFPVERVGTFECGDPLVDQAVRLCLVHAEVTMTDTYVDTPGREDGQWIEDAQLRALVSERWLGDTTLRRLLLRTHIESQRPDGHTHPFAPSNYPAHPATYDWSIQWIAALYDEFMWSGDVASIRTYWPQLCLYWTKLLEHVGPDGLWRHRHVLGDLRNGRNPATETQSSGMITPWIVERLRMSARLAAAAGETVQGAQWNAMADRLTAAYRTHHVIPASGSRPALAADVSDPADPTIERGLGQASHTIAIFADVFPAELARAAVDHVFAEPDGSPPADVRRWNNPTYFHRALQAMHHVGRTERALRHLIERFAPYLPGHPRNPVPPPLQGGLGGPLPEYFVSREDLGLAPGEPNTTQPEDETGSHGWAAVPLLWLHEVLLGVTIAEPGGARLRIAPNAAGLPYVTGTTRTPRGSVYVHYDPHALRLVVELPRSVVAELTWPAEMRPRRVRHRRDNVALPPVGSSGTAVLNRAGRHEFECA